MPGGSRRWWSVAKLIPTKPEQKHHGSHWLGLVVPGVTLVSQVKELSGMVGTDYWSAHQYQGRCESTAPPINLPPTSILGIQRPQRPCRNVLGERCASRRLCGGIHKHSNHVLLPPMTQMRRHQRSLSSPLASCSSSDLKDIGSTDPAVRVALVDAVRNACMNVGFLYGMLQQLSTIPYCMLIVNLRSVESWYTRRNHRGRPVRREVVLLSPTRKEDGGASVAL